MYVLGGREASCSERLDDTVTLHSCELQRPSGRVEHYSRQVLVHCSLVRTRRLRTHNHNRVSQRPDVA